MYDSAAFRLEVEEGDSDEINENKVKVGRVLELYFGDDDGMDIADIAKEVGYEVGTVAYIVARELTVMVG